MAEQVLDDWAASIDSSAILETAAALADPSAADLGPLAEQVRAVAESVDVDAALGAVSIDEPRAILARHPYGPVLGLRWYQEGEASTVHHHAWTILVGLDGQGTVERWAEGADGAAELRSTHGMHRGDVACIGDGEGHRQVSGTAGSLELVVIGDWTDARPRVDLEPEPASERTASLIRSYVGAFQRADAAGIAALCADDVLLDANVPHWRFQTAGSEGLADGLRMSEFGPDYRITEHRGRPTADGAVVELEAHLTLEGEDRLAREVHLVRCDPDGLIAEVTIYCTGIWNAETIERQRLYAPMVRR